VPQRLVEGRFRWYEYRDCPRCGSRLMIDGHGLLPHELRAQILAAGWWWLLVVDEGSSVPLLAFLKRRFSLEDDRPRLLELRQRLPGPLFAGAGAEMELLAQLFEAQAVRTHLEPTPAPPPGLDLADWLGDDV
jgi:hypothetical protein